MSVTRIARLALVATLLVFAGYGAWAAWSDATGALAREHRGGGSDAGELHYQKHAMMGGLMGEGASEQMHHTTPGPSEMMASCDQHMAEMSRMMEMMEGMDGMMSGGMPGGMMRGMMAR